MALNPAGVPSMADIQAAIDEAAEAATEGRAYREAAGSQSVTVTAAISGNVAVVLPVGRFTVAPIVTCSLASAPSGSQRLVPRAINVTETGFSIYVYTGDGATTTATVAVAWHAKQMTPTTAAG